MEDDTLGDCGLKSQNPQSAIRNPQYPCFGKRIGFKLLQFLLASAMGFVFAIGLTDQTASADNDLLGGIGDVTSGVLALPVEVLSGTLKGPVVFGTLNGALHGTVRAIGLTARGIFRLASVVIPLAKAAAPFVVPFLL